MRVAICVTDIEDEFDAVDEALSRVESAIDELKPFEYADPEMNDVVATLADVRDRLMERQDMLHHDLAERERADLAAMNRDYEASV